MDPTACLNSIYDATTAQEKAEHAQNLLEWLARRGFMPRDRDGNPLLMSRGQLRRYLRRVVALADNPEVPEHIQRQMDDEENGADLNEQNAREEQIEASRGDGPDRYPSY
jgi:hypothetical protein